MQSHFSTISIFGDKDCSPFPGMGEGTRLVGKSIPCFEADESGRQRALSVSAFAQRPLAQHNPSVKVPYFEGCIR